ncbi:heme exporter protein CcmD [Yoonia sp. MH D7]
MIPELGKYAAEVGLAYVVSIALLLGIVGLSWRQSVKQKRALDAAEARKNG